MINITQSVYQDVLKIFPPQGNAFTPTLPEDIASKFTSIPSRKIRQIIIDAYGRTALRYTGSDVDKLSISAEDLQLAFAKGEYRVCALAWSDRAIYDIRREQLQL